MFNRIEYAHDFTKQKRFCWLKLQICWLDLSGPDNDEILAIFAQSDLAPGILKVTGYGNALGNLSAAIAQFHKNKKRCTKQHELYLVRFSFYIVNFLKFILGRKSNF